MPLIKVRVPDIGDFADVAVIELLVKPGDAVKAEQSLVTVESDKASMEIPSSHAGVVQELKVKLGDKISQDDVLAVLQVAAADGEGAVTSAPAAGATPSPQPPAFAGAAPNPPASGSEGEPQPEESNHNDTAARITPSPPGGEGRGEGAVATSTTVPPPQPSPSGGGGATAAPSDSNVATNATLPHASPSVRKLARELGVPLDEVAGSGPKGRITDEDVQAFTRAVMQGQQQTRAQQAKNGPTGPFIQGALGADSNQVPLQLLPWPQVDFTQFGPTTAQPLSRIRKISAANLSRNWAMIPHVTYCEDADITELEALRVQLNAEKAQQQAGIKVTMLSFLIKACVQALKTFPDFNASLDGDALVHKQYYHIGFAADTPQGLMVPVIKDADKKGVLEISQDLATLSKKAREGKLSPTEMRGATFTISSLGGIGGTYFSPIINAPEVAILGVCRSDMQPRWNGNAFEPRLMLPLSLSADHRVIDGAAAARFNVYLAQLLADFRRVLL